MPTKPIGKFSFTERARRQRRDVSSLTRGDGSTREVLDWRIAVVPVRILQMRLDHRWQGEEFGALGQSAETLRLFLENAPDHMTRLLSDFFLPSAVAELFGIDLPGEGQVFEEDRFHLLTRPRVEDDEV